MSPLFGELATRVPLHWVDISISFFETIRGSWLMDGVKGKKILAHFANVLEFLHPHLVVVNDIGDHILKV